MSESTSADSVYQTIIFAGLAVIDGPINKALTASGASVDSIMRALHHMGFNPGDKTDFVKQVIESLLRDQARLKSLASDFRPLDDPRYGGPTHPPKRAKVLFDAAKGLEDAVNLHIGVLLEDNVITIE